MHVDQLVRDCSYIDSDWCDDQLSKQMHVCQICNCSIHEPSVHRLDNDRPHIKQNCVIVCQRCNRHASNLDQRSHDNDSDDDTV